MDKTNLEEKKKEFFEKFTDNTDNIHYLDNSWRDYDNKNKGINPITIWGFIEQLVKEEVAKAREGHSINCDYCGNRIIRRKSMCVRVKHSFCNHFCYTQYRKKHNYNLSGHSAEGWKNTSN